jgi:hypothetical protein
MGHSVLASQQEEDLVNVLLVMCVKKPFSHQDLTCTIAIRIKFSSASQSTSQDSRYQATLLH